MEKVRDKCFLIGDTIRFFSIVDYKSKRINLFLIRDIAVGDFQLEGIATCRMILLEKRRTWKL